MSERMAGWLRHWYRTAERVVRNPQRFFAEEEPSEDYGYTVRFAATSGLIAATLYLFLGLAVTGPLLDLVGAGSGVALVTIVVGVILGYLWLGFGTIGFSVTGALIHVTLRWLGVEGDMQTTKEVTAYASAVGAFFGWIPLLSILAMPYLFYVQIRGVEAFHDVPLKTAVLSVILPVLAVSLAGLLLVVAAAAASMAQVV